MSLGKTRILEFKVIISLGVSTFLFTINVSRSNMALLLAWRKTETVIPCFIGLIYHMGGFVGFFLQFK